MTEETKKQVLEHFTTLVQKAILLKIITSLKDAYTFTCSYCGGLIKFCHLDIETMQKLYDIAYYEFKTLKAGE